VNRNYPNDREESEEPGIAPSVMTAEFINPDGTRYNFEQIVIQSGLSIEITNETGDIMILRFWSGRVPDSVFPVDKKASQRYQDETIPNVEGIKSSPIKKLIKNALFRLMKKV
jgi:hypothetical protein